MNQEIFNLGKHSRLEGLITRWKSSISQAAVRPFEPEEK